jgi:hypothetical protein
MTPAVSGNDMRSAHAVAVLALAALALVAAPLRGADAPEKQPTPAECKRQVDEACAKTQDAMSLTSDELRQLVTRCERLAPVVNKLPDPHRKVLALRLKRCRDLYQFVLDTRERT